MQFNAVQRANLAVRKKRPLFFSKQVCDVFYSGSVLEIGFLSKRCSRDCQGACIMCDYGAAQGSQSTELYIREMSRILAEQRTEPEILLLCTNGSFFDSSQIDINLFRTILACAGQSGCPVVEIETHYRDVTAEKLRLVKEALSNKRVIIEMGLETTRADYQSRLIMKGVDAADYVKTCSLIRSFGFEVDANIMVGLPLLSPKEQFEDALNTIRWCFAHEYRPVLFPMNIKPYSLLMEAYRAGLVRPISQWLLPLVLDALTEEQLGSVSVAWYGNREQVYNADGERAIFPAACSECANATLRLFGAFSGVFDGAARKAMLRKMMTSVSCECLETAKQEITQQAVDTFDERYETFLSWCDAYCSGGA